VQDAQEKAAAFLAAHGMYYAQLDPERELRKFLTEMQDGLLGRPSSLKMIPTYLREDAPASTEPVIVLDIGGTNVRGAVVCLRENGAPEIRNRLSFPAPGMTAPVTSREFFRTIAEGIRPIIGESRRIGVCFSYATRPLVNKDAVVVAGGKQLKVPDLLGKPVGECLRAGLCEAGLDADKSVVVINDSVAATLGGRTKQTLRQFSGYVGFIYGTGTNICYSEPQESGGGMIVNVESGAYCGFPTGDIDDRFDAGLIDVGQDRFEKMVSGGYQGGLMTAILHQACGETLVSPFCCERLSQVRALQPREIDEYLNAPRGAGRLAACCGSESDRQTLCALMDGVTERSALLCAVSLCAALVRSGAGKDPARPAFITAEGSTFYASKDFSRKLEARMESLGAQTLGVHAEFFRVPDVTLAGTAIAGLSID
jgi:hexokinase